MNHTLALQFDEEIRTEERAKKLREHVRQMNRIVYARNDSTAVGAGMRSDALQRPWHPPSDAARLATRPGVNAGVRLLPVHAAAVLSSASGPVLSAKRSAPAPRLPHQRRARPATVRLAGGRAAPAFAVLRRPASRCPPAAAPRHAAQLLAARHRSSPLAVTDRDSRNLWAWRSRR